MSIIQIPIFELNQLKTNKFKYTAYQWGNTNREFNIYLASGTIKKFARMDNQATNYAEIIKQCYQAQSRKLNEKDLFTILISLCSNHSSKFIDVHKSIQLNTEQVINLKMIFDLEFEKYWQKLGNPFKHLPSGNEYKDYIKNQALQQISKSFVLNKLDTLQLNIFIKKYFQIKFQNQTNLDLNAFITILLAKKDLPQYNMPQYNILKVPIDERLMFESVWISTVLANLYSLNFKNLSIINMLYYMAIRYQNLYYLKEHLDYLNVFYTSKNPLDISAIKSTMYYIDQILMAHQQVLNYMNNEKISKFIQSFTKLQIQVIKESENPFYDMLTHPQVLTVAKSNPQLTEDNLLIIGLSATLGISVFLTLTKWALLRYRLKNLKIKAQKDNNLQNQYQLALVAWQNLKNNPSWETLHTLIFLTSTITDLEKYEQVEHQVLERLVLNKKQVWQRFMEYKPNKTDYGLAIILYLVYVFLLYSVIYLVYWFAQSKKRVTIEFTQDKWQAFKEWVGFGMLKEQQQNNDQKEANKKIELAAQERKESSWLWAPWYAVKDVTDYAGDLKNQVIEKMTGMIEMTVKITLVMTSIMLAIAYAPMILSVFGPLFIKRGHQLTSLSFKVVYKFGRLALPFVGIPFFAQYITKIRVDYPLFGQGIWQEARVIKSVIRKQNQINLSQIPELNSIDYKRFEKKLNNLVDKHMDEYMYQDLRNFVDIHLPSETMLQSIPESVSV